MFIGILLLILGVLLLLERMGIIYGDIWDYFLPVAMVALGVHLILQHRRKKM
ncbi:MAG TPA: DUF5668 domain-containing protein [Acidobacteriota bacterium]|nr:DUF5668 domain-containing protein [Acidobacteriota bacterium]